jgi:hypothetical protein
VFYRSKKARLKIRKSIALVKGSCHELSTLGASLPFWWFSAILAIFNPINGTTI